MPKNNTLRQGIVLSFDFGMKRIGIAVGQTATQTANPLPIISAKQGVPDWQQMAKLLKTWQPIALIVGLPLNMDGTEQSITIAAKQFAEQLKERFFLPVYTVDERLTTVAARTQLFEEGGYRHLKKQSVDSVAAQLILQDWLQHHVLKD